MVFLTKKKIEKIFIEWLKRYKENPDTFIDYPDSIDKYGKNSAEYFLELNKEI